jgi:hypothetical protein
MNKLEIIKNLKAVKKIALAFDLYSITKLSTKI